MSEDRREDDHTLKSLAPLIRYVHTEIKELRDWRLETTARLATGAERMDQMAKDIGHLDKNFKQMNESLAMHLERETRLSERVAHIEGDVSTLRDDVNVLKESRLRHKGMDQQRLASKSNWGAVATVGSMVIAALALLKSFAGK